MNNKYLRNAEKPTGLLQESFNKVQLHIENEHPNSRFAPEEIELDGMSGYGCPCGEVLEIFQVDKSNGDNGAYGTSGIGYSSSLSRGLDYGKQDINYGLLFR